MNKPTLGAAPSPADVYEQFFVPNIGAPAAKGLLAAAALQPGERVLDVACGTGVVTRAAAASVGSTGRVVGLDVNPDMLAAARKYAPADAEIEWRQASAESMPLPDEAFDVVLCQMGLQFMSGKTAALGEMRRVLSDGGRFAANLPGPAPDLFTILIDALARRIGDQPAAFARAVFSLHDEDEIRALLQAAGFREVDVASSTARLDVAEPREFLWQYIASTPIGAAVSQADNASRTALEREVTDAWAPFRTDDGMRLEVRMTTAQGRA